MRIGIDGRAFVGKVTGVSRYISELCKELARILPSAEFFIYCNQPIEIPSELNTWNLRIDNRRFSYEMKPVLWLKSRCGTLVRQDRLDCFWGGASFLPELEPSVKSILTVHDLTYIEAPKSMSLFHWLSFVAFLKADVQRATWLTVNSVGTRERLALVTGRTADDVIFPAANPIFTRASSTRIDAVLHEYKIDAPYFLAASTWEPRKNLELLIRAFLELKLKGIVNNEKLVLVGGRGWKDSRLLALARSDESIISPGYICDSDLAALYSGTLAFIFPSVYEGFGIPLLEARSCGAKIITTDIPELHESGGNDATYIRPTKDALVFAMSSLLSNSRALTPIPDASILSGMPTWSNGGESLARLICRQS